MDIDVGVHFVAQSMQRARQRPFAFLDLGFAPGGMSAMLLNSHRHIEGVGVTLEPGIGGNVFPKWLSRHSRFRVETGDVLSMALKQKRFQTPSSCRMFDLVIVGITVSGSSQADDCDAYVLKDLLLWSQLLLGFQQLKKGGMMLIRGYLSLRPLEFEVLHFLSKCFRKHPTATKPLTGLPLGSAIFTIIPCAFMC